MMLGFKKKDKNAVALEPRPSPEDLVKQYDNGKVLQIDNKIDNKAKFESLPKIPEAEGIVGNEEVLVEEKRKKTLMSKILCMMFPLFKSKLTKYKDDK